MIDSGPFTITRDRSLLSVVNGLVPSVQVTSVGGPSETLKLRVKTGGIASLVEMRDNFVEGPVSGPSIVVRYILSLYYSFTYCCYCMHYQYMLLPLVFGSLHSHEE